MFFNASLSQNFDLFVKFVLCTYCEVSYSLITALNFMEIHLLMILIKRNSNNQSEDIFNFSRRYCCEEEPKESLKISTQQNNLITDDSNQIEALLLWYYCFWKLSRFIVIQFLMRYPQDITGFQTWPWALEPCDDSIWYQYASIR